MKRFALFGHPVAHSLSPRIHAFFGKTNRIELSYELIDTPPEEFVQASEAFAEAGGVGANVTLPHKEAARMICSSLSQRAERAGAVNTLVRVDGGWIGDNTDGIGLIRDLTERRRFDLRGRRTLLIGAGGAAHGVAPALLEAGIGELWIVNRNADRADRLADRLGDPARVHTRYWEDLGRLGVFDLLINATTSGRDTGSLGLPFSLTSDRSVAVHLSYGDAAVSWLSWARASGCENVVDGLGMLVEQAALSFELWHGTLPQTDEIYAELKAHIDLLHGGD